MYLKQNVDTQRKFVVWEIFKDMGLKQQKVGKSWEEEIMEIAQRYK